MANETSVRVTADASGYTAELDRGRRSAEAFAQSQQQAAQRVQTAQQAIAEAATNGSNASARAINNFVSQLARTADQAGKTRAELLQMKAAQLGISESVGGYISSLEQASKQTHEFSLNSSAARRELLVLAHEAGTGNWTRFAGSMGVLAERTDALSLVMSPLGIGFGVVAAAAAAFVMEVEKGYAQIDAFNKAIASTNGFIGLSAGQMAEMSNGLQTTGERLSVVREAMAQVASTGAFTADSLQLATSAALAMSSDIGVSTDKAAESLAKIQDNVLEWVAKYQAAHHTFSAAQVEEIDNFVKQGSTAGAVKAVMQDLASAHQKIADDANKNMGSVLSWWTQWGSIIDRVKNSIMNIGVPDSIDKQVGDQYARVEAAQRNLKQQQSMGSMGNVLSAQQSLDIETKKLEVLRQQQTAINTQQRAREAAAKSGDAKVAVDSYLGSDKYASPSARHTNDLKAEDEAFKKATANLNQNSADYQAALKRHYDNVAQINEQYAKKTKPHEGGAFAGQLAAMTAANQVIEAEEKRHEQALKAARGAGLVDSETYLRQVAAIQTDALNQEIANAQKRVDIASSKAETAAYQEANAALKKLTDERAAIAGDLNTKLLQLQEQRARDVQMYSIEASKPGEQQAASYSAADATRYMSPNDAASYTAKLQLAQQYVQNMQALWIKYALDPTSDQKAWQQKVEAQQDAYDTQQQQLSDHLAREQQLRDSYSDQMHAAITKLGGDSQTNAQLAASAFTTAWQDASNALDTFVTTGQLNFDKLTAGILDDLAKIALHQAEMSLFQSIGTSFFSTGGAVGSYATGGPISGAGTGTSDSIPAMLSNGEYVVNAAATSKYRGLLDSINGGGVSHFAAGGAVGSVASSSSSSSGSTVHLQVNNNGGNGLTNEDAKALQAYVQAFVDKRITQRVQGQGGIAWQIRYNQV